jgi:hypothetical protein
MDKIITWEDLGKSGPIIQGLFQFKYPQGLALQDMLNHEEGWIRRAARRYLGEEVDN